MNNYQRSRIASLVSAALLASALSACGGDSPEKLIASGKEYLANNDGKAAVIQLKNALQQNPNLPEARFLLGKSLLETGDATGAVVELRKAFEQKYSQDQTIPLLAKAMLSSGQSKHLADEFSTTQLAPGEPTAELKTTLAVAYIVLGKNDAAHQALDAALDATPNFAGALLVKARLAILNKDIETAKRIVEEVLAKNPKNYDALLLAGSLASANNQVTEALSLYKKAADTKPELTAAHGAILAILIQQQNLDDAEKQLESLKKIASKQPQTIFFDAQIRYLRKDFKTARELAQQLLRVSTNSPQLLQLAGAIEYQLKSYEQAESLLSKALQASPKLPLARRLLTATYLQTGQASKAINTLEPVIDQADRDPTLLSLLGEAYLQTGDVNKAASYFSKASKLAPSDPQKRTRLALAHMAQGQSESAFAELEEIATNDKGIIADLALIAAHLRANQVDKALFAIDALEKKQPENPATYNLRAKTLLAKKDQAGARQWFEKALSVSPGFYPAAASLAALDMADKKPEAAQKRFESVIAADPRNYQAYLALAEIRANSGGSVEEISELVKKAISANPSEPLPRLALIKFLLTKKDNKKALSAANEAVAALPDKFEILDALGRVQQVSGDFNQALNTYGKLANLQPNAPGPHLRLAEIHLANKSKTDAAKSLHKALEIKPDTIEAQRGLILLALDAKRTEEALAIAREVEKQRPKEPVGYVLEGDIHSSQKSWANAVSAYRTALKFVQSTELAVKTHNALIASGASAEATKLANDWVKDHPKDSGFRVHLGDLAIARRLFAEANQHYQAALLLQPNNPLVLNNLAWVAGQLKSPKAIEYAEKANRLAPNQPQFMDTLAMLLAQNGNSSRAIELLRSALRIAPDVPVPAIQLNLAKVLIDSGNKTEAKKELEALAKLGDKFPANAEVNRLLSSL